MQEIHLISADYVYQNTNVNNSVEAAKIQPFVTLAQDKWVEPIIGTDLMNKIKDDSADASIAGNYLTLRDEYVRKTILWYTMQEMMRSLNFKIDNGSINQHNSEHTSAVGSSEMNALIEDAKSNAQFYENKLRSYLTNNASLFPEYSTNSGSDVQPKSATVKGFAFSGNNHQMHR
jgi:hypothetical protein